MGRVGSGQVSTQSIRWVDRRTGKRIRSRLGGKADNLDMGQTTVTDNCGYGMSGCLKIRFRDIATHNGTGKQDKMAAISSLHRGKYKNNSPGDSYIDSRCHDSCHNLPNTSPQSEPTNNTDVFAQPGEYLDRRLSLTPAKGHKATMVGPGWEAWAARYAGRGRLSSRRVAMWVRGTGSDPI